MANLFPEPLRSADTDGDKLATIPPPNVPSSNLEYANAIDDSDVDEMAMISPEEADESLIELSISQVATRMKSAQTPAIEKAAAMEEIEGGGYFDSGPDTPPVDDLEQSLEEERLESLHKLEGLRLAEENERPIPPTQPPKLSSLPSPRLDSTAMPTPWHAGPKPFDVPPQPPLAGVFSSERTRSRSGGAEALKKFLPKGLPSMSQMGNYFGSTSMMAAQKSPNPPTGSRSNRSSTMFTSSSFSRTDSSPQRRTFQSIVTSKPQAPPAQPQRPKTIRRSTSDNSLLYHSLSRASSLGDDTRFEKHTEQVNSRAKAIRDSLQDRSSFRMPQIPSMPSLKSMPSMPTMPSMPRVPSFSFNMNFLTASNIPTKWRNETDTAPDILPGNLTKKRPSALPSSAMPSKPTGSSRTAESAKTMPDGQSTNSFDDILESLTGDIVIMGGYRGSVLRSTKNHRQVWVPVKVGLNIRKVDLEVGLEPEDEERMEETIYPSGMLQNIGPVDISKRLFKRLSECENARSGKLRVWDYGYDWRLSPHLLSRKLTKFLEGLPSNQPPIEGSTQEPRGALVIAHSLGGLITRHVVNHRPELFSGVVYAGVPQACVNILGPLRNGDAVLLSSRVLTAQVNFTLRTSFLLLPEDGGCFIDLKTKERYPVNFFNLDDWIKYRWSPCTDPPLPPKNPQPSGGLGGLINMSSSLLSLPNSGKKLNSGPSSPTVGIFQKSSSPGEAGNNETKTTKAADFLKSADNGMDRTLAPQMGNTTNLVSKGQSTNQSISTTVTIPRAKAITYLARTLAETLKFKQELHFRPELSASNAYPPLALIYGKSIPTVYGAKVDGRDGIACADVYDNLAFASGDGVCLAKEAMLPPGYMCAREGRVSSDRGHVTLLGDLNAVGRALRAVLVGRGKGIGCGGEGVVGDC